MTLKIKKMKQIRVPTTKEFNTKSLKVANKAADKMDDYARQLKRRVK